MLIDTLRLGAETDATLAGRWRSASVEGLAELVAYEGAAIWLYRRLKTTGSLGSLPAELGDRLRTLAMEAAARRMQVEAEAIGVVERMESAGISVILIKGVARGALAQRHPYLDARATTDVDLLLPQHRLADADRLLRSAGYRSALPDEAAIAGHHHLPPLCNGPITVELHESTSVRVPPAVAWARANDNAEVLEWSGQPVRVASATENAWNAIAHAMEDGVNGFRLARFLEVSALVASRASIDWDVVRTRSITDEARDPDTPARDQRTVIMSWCDAMLSLVSPALWPAGLDRSNFPLGQLLRWRLAVLAPGGRVGSELAERLLEEGPRSLLGLPPQRAPATASWVGRIRRPIAGMASRVLFGVWRVTRGRDATDPSPRAGRHPAN